MFGGNFSDSEVFIPFTTARVSPRMGMICIAATKSPTLTEEAKAELTFFMRRQRGLKVEEENTFRIESVEQFVQQFNSVATAITMVAAGIVGISLLVGGVGIMNIMLVSVSERTREIGLRKAVGARPSAILLQFLIEAMMLCLMGGLMGLLCGQGLTTAMASIPDAKLEKAFIPGWAVALSFGFSAAVGLLFGMFPAIKAARLDPIEALRHE
jgi:putative ABC transport system permease protein